MIPAQSVAIVGIGGEFPSSPDLKTYWNNIVHNVNTSQEPPAGRWLLDVDKVYDPEPGAADKVYSRKACFLSPEGDEKKIPGLDLDPDFVQGLDPMFRLLLRVGQQTVADARGKEVEGARSGIIIGNLALPSEKSSAMARRFLGQTFAEQLSAKGLSIPEADVAPINQYVAGLPAAVLAKALGFERTCFTVDAACASSLYAIKLAIDELNSGRADAMLAGGLSRPDSLYTQMGFSQLRAVSPSGTCSPFDQKANGLVVGEGCGLVLLKRTEDAVRDGDHIYGIVRGIGLSNDIGGNLLAPASEGQQRAMRSAYKQAGWSPEDVDLIECHATGTPVGDKVEFQSLQELWKQQDWRYGQCVIGSVKANIGHLLTAAGSAALLKTLLAFEHEILPPTVNHAEPGPGIDLDSSPFRILKRSEPWSRRDSETPRRAAVSAFGFGGINAHLLLEEYIPNSKKKSPVRIHPSVSGRQQPVAIVGIAGAAGPWEGTADLKERLFASGCDFPPAELKDWWGAETSSWFQALNSSGHKPVGYQVPEVKVAPGTFRIPPLELKEMLPRQLLMLKVASQALQDAQLDKADLLFSGVYIGCGLDLNATNFSFRWGLENYARGWARELGLELDEQQFQAWVAQLKEHAGPALTANRTMGALGSTVASRIAKEFKVGGPSFTLSSEETSGLKALEIGVHALQDGAINHAIIGAVDFSCDLRSVISSRLREGGKAVAVPTDGAVALVLKRLEDAVQDKDRVYAVIGGSESFVCAPDTDRTADLVRNGFKQVQRSGSFNSKRIAGIFNARGTAGNEFLLSELSPGNGHDVLPVWHACDQFVGDSGGVAGLLAVVQGAFALYHKLVPGIPSSVNSNAGSSHPQYWLSNKCEGGRNLLVQDAGPDGSGGLVLLQEAKTQKSAELAGTMTTAMQSEGLFVLAASSPGELLEQCEALVRFSADQTALSVAAVAAKWYQRGTRVSQEKLHLSLIANSVNDLHELIAFAKQALTERPEEPLGSTVGHPLPPGLRERIFYSPNPLAHKGKIAFVFPGSGNHYAGMGQELSVLWPEVYQRQEQTSDYLADQYQPWHFWNNGLDPDIQEDHNALVISHVALCTALHDLLRRFNIHPHMISGYSLGESSGLFSTGAWVDRDGMLKRLEKSSLFSHELGGECRAARRIWNLPQDEDVEWSLGIVNASAEQVRSVIDETPRAYLLIINTYRECVIGGQRQAVEQVVSALGCHFIPLEGVTTVHCEVTKAVADAYRALHLFPVTAPKQVDYYSCALGKRYPLTPENAADVILAQALDTIDYPRVVEQLYADGARVFIEVGPGNSCSRMISSILGERNHLARSFCAKGMGQYGQVLRLLGQCLAEGVDVDLDPLFERFRGIDAGVPQSASSLISVKLNRDKFSPVIPAVNKVKTMPQTSAKLAAPIQKPAAVTPPVEEPSATVNHESVSLINNFQTALTSSAQAHEAFLAFSKSMEQAMAMNIQHQMQLLQNMDAAGLSLPVIQEQAANVSVVPPETPVIKCDDVAFDRDMCMEFAIGSVGKMLGPDFAPVDQFPTRVRLPDEPLMLVDRIMTLEGEPRSLSHGRVVTEHDVTSDRWYLDGNRIPTCVAVEAGQADLFLSGYLGIDFITTGKAVYRLLDAVVTFHRGLPQPGDIIRYDIKIERFFRQDQTYLFRFNFEGTVNGEPLLSMEKGCAGFFTAEELAAGKGIIHTKLDLLPKPGVLPADWRELVPLREESYDEAQVDALYAGDIATCFGPAFGNLTLKHPYTLPGGKLKLVDRVTKLDPQGGRYGLGQISAEMDIDPQDWFLTCHFVDDRVMPGTLMYECCMHTLRIYLLRMGWIGEEGETWCEPVPGVASGLKCRGQVIESTKKVTYQVSIKELGYGPEPFAIVDALMFADGHPIVEIPDMSVRLAGLNRQKVESLWLDGQQSLNATTPERKVLYDTDRITAFAIGNPSDAFGEPYRVFDHERKIARLPGPPFQFLDRIVELSGEPWKLVEGASVVAEYDVPVDAWYFAAGRQPEMPFSVLLEIGLQPCGWLAAYLGSALTSDVDLCFRNLDGNAVQLRAVTPDSGTLSIAVTITRVASSGGMIIQGYDFTVSDSQGPVYQGDTVFGFFSKEALAQQVGVRGAQLYQLTDAERERAKAFAYPLEPPFPASELRMVDQIDLFVADGGPAGLGYIRGSKQVDPDEWFFKAHFYQDPVCPGSLGLESYLQLLKVVAAERWDVQPGSYFETIARGQKHSWNYRGQVIPTNKEVVIEAVVTAIDDEQKLITAEGFLSVDGKVIYQMKHFTLRLH